MITWAISGPRPIGQEEIERLELGEVVGALAPLVSEVAVAPPFEIPDVGERQNVAFNRSRRLPGDVRRPVAVDRRLDRAPPDEQHAEGDHKPGERGQSPSREQRNCGNQAKDREQARHDPPCPIRPGETEPERERRPCAQERDGTEAKPEPLRSPQRRALPPRPRSPLRSVPSPEAHSSGALSLRAGGRRRAARTG